MRNLISVLLILSLIGATLSSSFYYTPEKLVSSRSASNYVQLYDPENFLKNLNFDEISKIVTHLKNDRKFEVFIYVFSYMDQKYGYDKDKDIEWFTNDVAYLKFQGQNDLDENSIFLMLAIGDRQSRVRTGKNPKAYLQDKKCTEYLDSVISLLKNEYYSEALLEILGKIEQRIFDDNQFFTDLWSWIWDIFIQGLNILLICAGILIFIWFTGKRISKTAEEQLEKIKKITKNGKPRREILQQVCVICLDDLQSNVEEAQANSRINPNNEAPSVESNEINYDRVQKEEEEKINNNRRDDNFIAKLECGHTYHSKCLSEWMVKNNKCPVCKEKIDKEETDDHPLKPNNLENITNESTMSQISTEFFVRSLVNIQTSRHPELSTLDYTYSSNGFTWTRTESSKSSYSFSWGSGGGGGSSKW